MGWEHCRFMLTDAVRDVSAADGQFRTRLDAATQEVSLEDTPLGSDMEADECPYAGHEGRGWMVVPGVSNRSGTEAWRHSHQKYSASTPAMSWHWATPRVLFNIEEWQVRSGVFRRCHGGEWSEKMRTVAFV